MKSNNQTDADTSLESGVSSAGVEKTTQQDNPMNNNPTGKGGFGDNPQNRNPGGWKKEDAIPYQYNRFMRMEEDELEEFVKNNKLTVAQRIAYNRLKAAKDSLPDAKEVTDRTSGKAKETIEHTVIEQPIPLEDLR